jgi:hypothetical protein
MKEIERIYRKCLIKYMERKQSKVQETLINIASNKIVSHINIINSLCINRVILSSIQAEIRRVSESMRIKREVCLSHILKHLANNKNVDVCIINVCQKLRQEKRWMRKMKNKFAMCQQRERSMVK